MRLSTLLLPLLSLLTPSLSEILENGQPRLVPYPGGATKLSQPLDTSEWRTYPASAREISYKGRWDDKYISWWSAPGVKFGFRGGNVAVGFGEETSEGVLVAYRVGGQQWRFANVTASATYQFITPETPGMDLLEANATRIFEMRVTNWSYGVQISSVSVDCKASGGALVQLRNKRKMVEIIGDSISAGMYNSYEGLSGWAWGFVEGLGDAEFSITAYPGICLHDQDCWGNPRGQTYQWQRVSDTSWRASQLYGTNPPKWNFKKQQPADLVVINIGTNDFNEANGVTTKQYFESYVKLIGDIHRVWPKAQIIIQSLWHGFHGEGDTFVQDHGFDDEIRRVVNKFRFVHLFNTTGILRHNDIAPQWHPTDVGQIKVASHLLEFVKAKFGWEYGQGDNGGAEVFPQTLYWNDEQNY
ncbi:hypothetical protein AJ80_06948 [Polytolypa hystricis UAMH7299]|uniref:SGNH hydrolase-type esterase domain-containing protein n=1 Tax=Polytolypa hystricis (strain UAMH7299) TaxID=1447883 RepID=A0A2B7XSY6_POLH7|nr:hypothetical protein AJ80_06948 [Polytolypa hystricis UAMH7299]